MAITLRMDRLDPAAVYDDNEDGIKIVRIGFAEGIPVDTPAHILPAALEAAGMPGKGEGHPTRPSAKLRRRIVRPVDAGDKARVELYYDSASDFGGTPNGTFVMRDSTGLTTEMVQLNPELKPIQVRWTPSGGTQVKKTLTLPRTTTMRTLSVYATLDRRPSISAQLAVDDVNDRTWQGLGKGFWKCAGLDATFTDATGAVGVYTAGAVFITRNYRDWSDYGWYVDQFGEIPTEDDGLNPDEIKALMEEDYVYGERYANGFTKVGQYRPNNFGAVFGV